MRFTIRNANPGDKAVVTDMLARSFADNLSVQFIAGNGTNKQRKILALMGYAFEMCQLFGEVLVTEDLSGCALVIYPERKKATLKSVMLDLGLIFNCMGLAKVAKVLKRESRVHDLQAEGHNAYVWFIGVDPAHQYQGIGTVLLEKVMAVAAKYSRNVLLETSTLKNIRWYKSFGFCTYATLDLGYKLFFLKNETCTN